MEDDQGATQLVVQPPPVASEQKHFLPSASLTHPENEVDQTQLVGAPTQLIEGQGYQEDTQLLEEDAFSQGDTQPIEEVEEGEKAPSNEKELGVGGKAPARKNAEEGGKAPPKSESQEREKAPAEGGGKASAKLGAEEQVAEREKHPDLSAEDGRKENQQAEGGWRVAHHEEEGEQSGVEYDKVEPDLDTNTGVAPDTLGSGKNRASQKETLSGEKKSSQEKETPPKAPPAEAVGGWRTVKKSREEGAPSKEETEAALKSSQTVSEPVDSDAPTESDSNEETEDAGTLLDRRIPSPQVAADERILRDSVFKKGPADKRKEPSEETRTQEMEPESRLVLQDSLQDNNQNGPAEKPKEPVEKGRSQEDERRLALQESLEDVIPDSDTEGPDGRELEAGTVSSVNAPSVNTLFNKASLPGRSLLSRNLGEGPNVEAREEAQDEADREPTEADAITGLEEEPSQREGTLSGAQELALPSTLENGQAGGKETSAEKKRGSAEGVGQKKAREAEKGGLSEGKAQDAERRQEEGKKKATNGEMQEAHEKDAEDKGADLEMTESEALPPTFQPVTADNQPIGALNPPGEEAMPELRPDQREPPFTQIPEDPIPLTTYTRRSSLVPKAQRTWSTFSAEPGEETQREALGVVDAMLGLGDVDLSQEEERGQEPNALPAGTRTPGLSSLNIPVVPPRTLSIFDFQGSQNLDIDFEEPPKKTPERKTPKASMAPPKYLPQKGSGGLEEAKTEQKKDTGGWISKKGSAKKEEPRKEVTPARGKKAPSNANKKAEPTKGKNGKEYLAEKLEGLAERKGEEELTKGEMLDAVLGVEQENEGAAEMAVEKPPRAEEAQVDWTQVFAVPDTQEEANVRLKRETPQKHADEARESRRGLFAASLFANEDKTAEEQEAKESIEASVEEETAKKRKGRVPRVKKVQKEKEAKNEKKEEGVGTRATRSAKKRGRPKKEEAKSDSDVTEKNENNDTKKSLAEGNLPEQDDQEQAPESEKLVRDANAATKDEAKPSTHRVKQTAKRRQSNRVTADERAAVKRRLDRGLEDTEEADEESEGVEESERTEDASALVLDSQVPISLKYKKLKGAQGKAKQPKNIELPSSKKQVGAKTPVASLLAKKVQKGKRKTTEAPQAVKAEAAPETQTEVDASTKKRGLDAETPGNQEREPKRMKGVQGRPVNSRFKEAAASAKKQGVEKAEKTAPHERRRSSTIPLAGLIRTRKQRESGDSSLSQKPIASLRKAQVNRGKLAATKEEKGPEVKETTTNEEEGTGREDPLGAVDKIAEDERPIEEQPVTDAQAREETEKAEGKRPKRGRLSHETNEVEFLEERRRSTARESEILDAEKDPKSQKEEGTNAETDERGSKGGASSGKSNETETVALRKGKRSIAKRQTGEGKDETAEAKRPAKRSKRSSPEEKASRSATVKTESRRGKRKNEADPKESQSTAEEKSQSLRKSARRSGEEASQLSTRVSGRVSSNLEGLGSPKLRRRRDMGEVRVYFSNRVADQVKEAQKKILKRLGAHEAKDVPSCTHLVADSFGRTKNMLEAIVGAKKIVKPSWLDSCGQASYFEDEAPHMLNDEPKEKEFKFSMKASLAAAEETRIFDGAKVYITPNTTPDRNFFRSILEMGGGELLTRFKPGDCIVVSSEEDRKVWEPLAAKGVPIHTTELLMAAVVQQNLDLSTNLLSDGKTKADSKGKASKETRPQRKTRAWR